MKIAIIGATGMIGQRIVQEALARGHEVTAVARHPEKLAISSPRLHAKAADVDDPKGLAAALAGNDVVLSAYGPGPENFAKFVPEARSLLEGVERSGVPRLIVVGGAGSLEVAPGVQLVDTPNFPAAWKGIALAHRDAFPLFKAAPFDWAYASPPAMIEPAERTGKYRTGADQLLVDEKGSSRISAEDFAVALLDEAEKPKHPRQRFTVAY
jgi:hypothetical protein